FFGYENIAATIGSALLAGTVRELALVAVGALGEAGWGKKVVAAALGSPLLGVAPFRIRHSSIPFNRPWRLRDENTWSTRQKLDFSALARACRPDPQAHSIADRPEPRRRSISLDSGSDHSADKALCNLPYRGYEEAGRVTPARAPHPPAKDRSPDNNRFRSHPGELSAPRHRHRRVQGEKRG